MMVHESTSNRPELSAEALQALESAMRDYAATDGCRIRTRRARNCTIRWSPPLILTKENVDVALEIFDEAVSASV